MKLVCCAVLNGLVFASEVDDAALLQKKVKSIKVQEGKEQLGEKAELYGNICKMIRDAKAKKKSKKKTSVRDYYVWDDPQGCQSAAEEITTADDCKLANEQNKNYKVKYAGKYDKNKPNYPTGCIVFKDKSSYFNPEEEVHTIPDICEDDTFIPGPFATKIGCPHARWANKWLCDNPADAQRCQVTCSEKLNCERKLLNPPVEPKPEGLSCVAPDAHKFCKKRHTRLQDGDITLERFCHACAKDAKEKKYFQGARQLVYHYKFKRFCGLQDDGSGSKCCEEMCSGPTTPVEAKWPTDANGCPTCKCSEPWLWGELRKAPGAGFFDLPKTNGCDQQCGASCPDQGCCCVGGVTPFGGVTCPLAWTR